MSVDLDLACRSLLVSATLSDLAFVDSLQHQYSETVGFLRRSDLEYLILTGSVGVVWAGDQPVGSLVYSAGRRLAPCLRQVCVPDDLWRRGLGEALTRAFVQAARCPVGRRPRVRTRSDCVTQCGINARCGGVVERILPGGRRGRSIFEYWFGERGSKGRDEGDDLLSCSIPLSQYWPGLFQPLVLAPG